MRLLLASFTLLLSGCVAANWVPTPGKPFQYAPLAPLARVGGSALIEARYDPSPEITRAWTRVGLNQAEIERYRADVAHAMAEDIAYGNFFDNVVRTGGPVADRRVTVGARTYQAGNMVRLELALSSANGATGVVEGIAKGSCDLGPPGGPQAPLAVVLPNFLQALKRDLATAVAKSLKEEADARALARLKSASLPDLLVSSEQNPVIARERNRALVAAKNQLPELLRTARMGELSALVVRVEQTILDLSHEAEVAKDKAQQSVEAGPPQQGRAQGYLGVEMGPSLVGNGVPIVSVVPGSPAEKAGLRVKDIIVSIDEAIMSRPDLVKQSVERSQAGVPRRFVIRRGGANQTVSIVVAESATTQGNSVERFRDFAISYRERIELLKPILAALREEIANRNR